MLIAIFIFYKKYVMKGNKMRKISITSLLTFLCIVFLSLNLFPVYADEPSEPRPANAMWVEPSIINLQTYSIGDKFNVTIWVNMSTLVAGASGIDTWQVRLYYNTTYLRALRVGLTGGQTSQLFKGLSTTTADPIIQENYVFWGETTLGAVYKPVPCYGSLMWIEFNVTSLAPQPINFELSILNVYSWVADDLGNKYPPKGQLDRYNSIVIPELPESLAVASLMILTIMAIIANKKCVQKTRHIK